jgi:hypothetical protein
MVVLLKSKKFQTPDHVPVYLRVSMAVFKYGLPRTRLFKLIAEGLIESKLVLSKGAKRGTRLILEKSLRAYIEKGGAS